ncbi:MAG: hypothetical protein P9L92_17420 [Candidatus Electryonea clarkiae]|nr:hypothetical protein [Candidatus Electryonea clarkiae]
MFRNESKNNILFDRQIQHVDVQVPQWIWLRGEDGTLHRYRLNGTANVNGRIAFLIDQNPKPARAAIHKNLQWEEIE